MFGSKKRQKQLRDLQSREAIERFDRNERLGGDIYKRIATLHEKPNPSGVAYDVLMLLREAQHLEALIRQSIKDRTDYDFDFGTQKDGDLATYLGGDITYALRDHVTNPQTLFQALSDQFPDVHFSIHRQDAISMISAIIRVQRLGGIIEGLELAGVAIPRG
jgi:hypothetical protein